MAEASIEEFSGGIRVRTGYWLVEHSRQHGGAWSSVSFAHGTGRNLLRRPVSSALRFVKPDPASEDGIYSAFWEHLDRAPRLLTDRTPDGYPVVIAEGTYRDEAGKNIPVGFRRRTEYRDHGLVWTTLELMSDSGCEEVVEVRAFDLALRPGLTHAYVRFHPTQAGGADLLGGRAWYDQGRPEACGDRPFTAFSSRFTPLQMICFERGGEGIELLPGADLPQWDCGLKPDMGLGLYQITQHNDGTSVELSPYCLAFRRMKIRVQGNISFRLGIGLPSIKPRPKTHSTIFHVSAGSDWPSDGDIARAAQSGVKLIRFHNDYRENGIFWRDGVYPPYDAAGMRELRRVIDSAHRNGMKIVPYVSVKELHPSAPEFSRHAREWMHMAAPSLDIVHTWVRSGEFGGLMCLQSGWLDFRKRTVDQILGDLPWDGLYLDWTIFHPCCHPNHGRGPYHADVAGFLEFLRHCRQKIGAGLFFLHTSGIPSVIAENMADLIFLYEDQGGTPQHPAHFPVQCDFLSIVPRQLVGGRAAGSVDARRFIMGGHLQGHPPCAHIPAKDFSEESLREMALFKDLDLKSYDFYRASESPVDTGNKEVHAAAWLKSGACVIYAANFSAAEKSGHLKLRNVAASIPPASRARWTIAATEEAGAFDAQKGIPYKLKAWSSIVVALKA